MGSNDVCGADAPCTHITHSARIIIISSNVFEISCGSVHILYYLRWHQRNVIFLSFSRDLCVFVAQKPLSDNKRLIRADVSQI